MPRVDFEDDLAGSRRAQLEDFAFSRLQDVADRLIAYGFVSHVPRLQGQHFAIAKKERRPATPMTP